MTNFINFLQDTKVYSSCLDNINNNNKKAKKPCIFHEYFGMIRIIILTGSRLTASFCFPQKSCFISELETINSPGVNVCEACDGRAICLSRVFPHL